MRDVTRRFEEVKELKRKLAEAADQAGKLARERRG
jgi:hypothetical protein